MHLPDIQPGDILLYYRDGGLLSDPLIKLGEVLEDGPQSVEYYHCAIALDAKTKIETNGFEPVCVTNIIYDGTFDVFRPPIDQKSRNEALQKVMELQGQHYDWLLILDDAFRFMTFNLIHLPENRINNSERRRKICSTLVAFYFESAKWGELRKWPRPTPEDIWLEVQEFPVEG